MSEYEHVYDHPRPIVCTCGHPLGVHDLAHPQFECTRCPCDLYFTDWDVAHELGYTAPPNKISERASARTRWMQYRKQGG